MNGGFLSARNTFEGIAPSCVPGFFLPKNGWFDAITKSENRGADVRRRLRGHLDGHLDPHQYTMYIPPAELNSSLIVSVLLQVLNGVVGKVADKRVGS